MASSPSSRWREAVAQHRSLLATGVFGSLTLGLAPYVPHAHIYKQLRSLARGTLTQPLDVFDLLLHGAPWLVLLVAVARIAWTARRGARRFETPVQRRAQR